MFFRFRIGDDRMSRSIVLSPLLVVLLLVGCSSPTAPQATVGIVGKPVSVEGGTYTGISVSELESMLANKDFTLVNVHIPFEGNIAHTDLSIPYDKIAQNLDKLPEKAARIVLYCRSGRMSSIAAEILVGLGYTNVFSLNGGMAAWEQAGQGIEH
jgi:rhodanese-related sulfurtransferase